MESIYVITKDRLIKYGENLYVVSLFESDDIMTIYDDDRQRPCQDGDVLSIQPDGTWQGRVTGVAGPFETCKITSKGLLYRPKEQYGKSYLVPYDAE